MPAIICILLPPLLLVAVRHKLRKQSLEWNIGLLVEYLISTLILNLIVMMITYFVGGNSQNFSESLNNSVGFTVQYMALASVLALLEPIIFSMVNLGFKYKPFSFNMHSIAIILFYFTTLTFGLIGFMRCFDNAFWGDEGYTIRLAKMSLKDMIYATAGDVHPPLYYFLVKGLYCLFGNNGFTYQLSAWLPYCAILLLACSVIRKEFGVITACIVVVFDSVISEAITHNAEARMYTLAAFFVLAAYVELYYILKSGKIIHWVLFAICSLGAAYTHYYALITVAFFYLTLLIMMFFQHKLIKPTVITSVMTIVGYLPWLTILISTFKRTAAGWWSTDIPEFKNTLQSAFDRSWLLYTFFVIVLIYTLYQLKVLNFKYDKQKWKDKKDVFQIRVSLGERLSVSRELSWILSGVMAFVGTAIVGMGVSRVVRPLFLIRYIYPASLIAYMVMGHCLSKLNFRRLYAVLLCVAILWMNVPVLLGTCRSERELNRETTKFMQMVSPEKDARICTNVLDINWTLADYYYPGIAHSYYDTPTAIEADEKTFWLIWRDKLSDDSLLELSQRGLNAEEVYEGRFPNTIYCYVYRVVR